MTKKTIIFTGGGSGGHVMPALTLIQRLLESNYKIHYIGGRAGIERELVRNQGISYSPIFTGKLRRYFSLENFIDIFKVALGFFQSIFTLVSFKRKETLVFSTGGFVSVPVVLAAKLLGFKVFLHEQTTRVGLANKICGKLADKSFVSFEESLQYFPRNKAFYTGYPLRQACYEESIGEVSFLGKKFNEEERPILFATGGGNGSLLINELIEKNLAKLCDEFIVIHQVGKNFIEKYKPMTTDSYYPLSFIHNEMIDLYKLADVIISRAGAGTVCELMALKKSSLFIPLKIAQKNEQYHNAMEASHKLGSIVIEEDQLEGLDLMAEIRKLKKSQKQVSDKIIPNGVQNLLEQVSSSFT